MIEFAGLNVIFVLVEFQTVYPECYILNPVVDIYKGIDAYNNQFVPWSFQVNKLDD